MSAITEAIDPREGMDLLESTEQGALRREAFLGHFEALFGCKASLAAEAGGRVNLIGEHVDYPDLQFGGEASSHLFSMGGAIQNSYLVAMGSREDGILELVHLNASERFRCGEDELEDLERKSQEEREAGLPMAQRCVPPWAHHTLGAVMEARAGGWRGGLNLLLTSNVPHGSGMSNSAANCVALALAFQKLHPELPASRDDAVAFARRAENSTFVGGHCGWLDQMLIVHSSPGRWTRIDYADRKVDHFAAKLPAHWQWVAINTNVPHVLAESEYPDRVAELSLGIELLRLSRGEAIGTTALSLSAYDALLEACGQSDPFVLPEGLEDVGIRLSQAEAEAWVEQWSAGDWEGPWPHHQGKSRLQSIGILIRRMRHQKKSSLFVGTAGEAASRGDGEALGRFLDLEGQSLRMNGDFQITGDNGAQDELLDIGLKLGEGISCHGRMLGGGGGGNVLFFVSRSDEAAYGRWKEKVSIQYERWASEILKDPSIRATFIEPTIEAGAELFFEDL